MNDFNNTNITIVFEPDEDAGIYEKGAPISVTDDAINEATEQVFVVELRLVSSVDPAGVNLTTQPSSLCKIIDYHDCKQFLSFKQIICYNSEVMLLIPLQQSELDLSYLATRTQNQSFLRP